MDEPAVLTPIPASGAGGPDPGGGGRAVVPALTIGVFAIGTDMFVVAALIGPLAAELAVPVGVGGLTVTAYAVAYAAGAPVLGAVLGTFPPRRVLIGSLLVFALGAVVSALATTVAVLLGARVLSGLAASGYGPMAAATAVASGPASRRGRTLGVLQGSSSVAMVAGAPLGLLLAASLSWRAAFGLVAALAAVAVLVLLGSAVADDVAGRDPGRRRSSTAVASRLRPLRSRPVVGSLGVTFLVMAASNSMFSYLGVLLGATAATVGLGVLVAVFGLGGVLGTWWGGATSDRWGGGRAALLAGLVLTAAVGAVPLAATSAAVVLAVVLCWGFAGWAFVPGQQHRLLGLGSGPPPFLLALNSSAIQLGFAAGALLGGMIVDTAGADRLWLLAVSCGAAGLALHAMLLTSPRKVAP